MVKHFSYLPVFIGGSPSTGSTLLRILLNRHPEIFSGPELSAFNKRIFLTRFADNRSRFPKWLNKGLRTSGYATYYKFFHHIEDYGISKEQLTAWSKDASTTRELLDRFICHSMADRNARIFVEKTPSNAYCFPELAKMYPEAKFIHLYRDGRDVACSLQKRRYNWFQATCAWLFNTAAALRLRGNPQYLECSYEELVANPESSLQKITDFLGIEYLPTMISKEGDTTQLSKNIRNAWNNHPRNEIRETSKKRYECEFTNTARVIFDHTMLTREGAERLGMEQIGTKDIMQQLGYGTEPKETALGYKGAGYLQQYHDRVLRIMKSYKRLEKPDPPLMYLRF